MNKKTPKKKSDMARVADALERIAVVFETALKLAEGFSSTQDKPPVPPVPEEKL